MGWMIYGIFMGDEGSKGIGIATTPIGFHSNGGRGG
jgi:hypothetical protein